MQGAQKRDAPIPVGVTARRMADAVEYLMRVARDAGLSGIAVKLTTIRVNLLNVAAGQPDGRARDDKSPAATGIELLKDASNDRH